MSKFAGSWPVMVTPFDDKLKIDVGAYRAMIILVLLQTPAILWRRRQEEARLQEKFGQEYDDYRRHTWF